MGVLDSNTFRLANGLPPKPPRGRTTPMPTGIVSGPYVDYRQRNPVGPGPSYVRPGTAPTYSAPIMLLANEGVAEDPDILVPPTVTSDYTDDLGMPVGATPVGAGPTKTVTIDPETGQPVAEEPPAEEEPAAAGGGGGGGGGDEDDGAAPVTSADALDLAIAAIEAQYGLTKEQLLADKSAVGQTYRQLVFQARRQRTLEARQALLGSVERGITRSGITAQEQTDLRQRWAEQLALLQTQKNSQLGQIQSQLAGINQAKAADIAAATAADAQAQLELDQLKAVLGIP